MTDHPSLSEQRAHLIAREMEAFEAAYPCCDLTKYKAGEVIAGRARYAEPEVDKMFSAWLAARTPNPQSENLMVHAQEWLDHLRSDGPHALHTAAANLERVIQQIAFAQPPASGVDREALEGLDILDLITTVMHEDGRLNRPLARKIRDALADALTNSGAPVPSSTDESLRMALRDVEPLLSQLALPARLHPDGDVVRDVRELGDRIGYGAMMDCASAIWRIKLEESGAPGGEFAVGPCQKTAENAWIKLSTVIRETR